MAQQEPVAECMLDTPEAAVTPWTKFRERWESGGTHWLATVRPDGRPHLVPIGPRWLGERVYFTTGQGTRKEMNLAANPHCMIGISTAGYDLMVEGDAAKLQDPETLVRLAADYAADGWPASVSDGVLTAPFSAPTTGPAPYEVYEVIPTRAFALGTEEATVNGCTRYRF